MRSPHVEAACHLPLLPGTNVAVLTALAHVIVTEGLVNEQFVRERCDWDEFQHWAEFVAEKRNSPEEVAKASGVPAEIIRKAARLFAKGGNGAIYYGLGVTEHSQGSTTVIGDCKPRHADRQHRAARRGREPVAWPEQRARFVRHGIFPARTAGVSPREERRRAGEILNRSGVSPSSQRTGSAHSEHAGRRGRGHVQGAVYPGRRHPAIRPRHASRCGRSGGDGMCHRPRPVPERDRELRALFLPGSTFLEKDGTFTNAERRIKPVRKVMAKNGYADWEMTVKLAKALGAAMGYDHPEQIMDEIARLTPAFAGVSYEKIEELGSVQWPCNEKAPAGTPVMHMGGFVRGKGKFIITEYVATDEKTGPRFPCCSPPAASSASIMSARRRAAPRTSSGTTRMGWRSIRMTPSSAACTTAIGSSSRAVG